MGETNMNWKDERWLIERIKNVIAGSALCAVAMLLFMFLIILS